MFVLFTSAELGIRGHAIWSVADIRQSAAADLADSNVFEALLDDHASISSSLRARIVSPFQTMSCAMSPVAEESLEDFVGHGPARIPTLNGWASLMLKMAQLISTQ